MIIKLGLIGKNISHSKSPELYKKNLAQEHTYSLLDFASSEDLPTLDELFENFDGINITSPYKEHYLKDVECSHLAREVSAINCLALKYEKFYGENTDLLACLELIDKYKISSYPYVYLLGNGPMARVIQTILSSKNIKFQNFSRSLGHSMNDLKFSDQTNFIINACAREYIFETLEPCAGMFWDLNYSHPENKKSAQKIPSLGYIDGLELLELQALKAIEFWNFPK